MAQSIKDGTGTGVEAEVNDDHQLLTRATTSTEEHHENEDHQRSWTGVFDAIDPAGADDYFVNIKNTATAVRAVTRVVVTSTVAGYLEIQRVTGTSVNGTGDEISSFTFGGSDPADFTFESGTDITGLADAGVAHFHWLEANKTAHIEFPQHIRLLQNEQMALLWTVSTGILTGNVDFYEEG